EAYEAYSHFYLLQRYLDTVGYMPVKDIDVIEIRKKDVGVSHENKVKELVNFMATEHFAANFFKDLSNTASEPVLKKILMDLSVQEVLHSQFAFDLLANSISKDKKVITDILENASKFQHVGAYVLPTVSKVKEDNISIIKSFNEKIEKLTGKSLSAYLASK
ncbi:MAG: hypothetical protein AABX51_06400, partial [Nanoarchaeota archaeon]